MFERFDLAEVLRAVKVVRLDEGFESASVMTDHITILWFQLGLLLVKLFKLHTLILVCPFNFKLTLGS